MQQGWQAQSRATDAGPAIEYRHADYVGGIGLIEPFSSQFCDLCNRLRVSSQGKVHLCLFDNGSCDVCEFLATGDVDGLVNALQRLMPIQPEHHHFPNDNNSVLVLKLMTNLASTKWLLLSQAAALQGGIFKWCKTAICLLPSPCIGSSDLIHLPI